MLDSTLEKDGARHYKNKGSVEFPSLKFIYEGFFIKWDCLLNFTLSTENRIQNYLYYLDTFCMHRPLT